jgi:hypothetical protein
MPIRNLPILANRSRGVKKTLLGVFSTTMYPGIVMGIAIGFLSCATLDILRNDLEMRYLPDSKWGNAMFPTVVLAYMLVIGNNKQKGWQNLSKFSNPFSGIPTQEPPRSIFGDRFKC